jgi:hypothetical protein
VSRAGPHSVEAEAARLARLLVTAENTAEFADSEPESARQALKKIKDSSRLKKNAFAVGTAAELRITADAAAPSDRKQEDQED